MPPLGSLEGMNIRILAAVATTVITAPLAMADHPSGSVIPNTNTSTVLQEGTTRRVSLGTVNSGTGYVWKWTSKPKARIATGLAPKVVVSKKGAPGASTTVYARIHGVDHGKISGVMGLFAPGTKTPTTTVTIRITVTDDDDSRRDGDDFPPRR